MITHVKEISDKLNAGANPPQPLNKHLGTCTGSGNVANRSKNNYRSAWMVDYIEEHHGEETFQQMGVNDD